MQATEGNVKFNLDYSGSEGGLDFENFLARLENFRGHASRMRRRRIQLGILRRLLHFGDTLMRGAVTEGCRPHSGLQPTIIVLQRYLFYANFT